MKDLKTNSFIENDFLKSKEFVIDTNRKRITIANCDVTIELLIKQRDLFVKRNIHVNETVIISTKQEMTLFTKFSISDKRNFLFELFNKINVTLYHHVMNFFTNIMIVKNDFFKFVRIFKNFRFETVTNIT